MSSEVDIRIRNLSKVYRIYERPEDRLIQMATLGRLRRFTEFAALNDVSLDIRRGETVGIVGRNGCGKSTLLQLICGTLQPTSGTVEVTGRIAALLELGAGFSGEFTGRENVFMNGAILGFSREEMDARFDQIADFAGIGEFIERPVKTYSSGMFVRLAFAVATAVEPDILVVDEALSVGDEAFQRKCFARIEAIKERGGTILFVSHGAQTIVQLCDRAVLLDGGEVILQGDPRGVVGRYQRLVNANPASAPAIREELRELGRLGPLQAVSHVEESEPAVELLEKQPDGFAEPPQHEDFFDPDLRSESQIEYESKGVRISNVRIIGEHGQERNLLARRRRYTIAYDVLFSCDAANVAFGFMISTVSGLDVAGAGLSSRPELQQRQVRSGQSVSVRFDFDCLILPGVYFLTVGCSGVFNNEREYLHRIIDAYPFRILSEGSIIETGIFDLKVKSHVEFVVDMHR